MTDTKLSTRSSSSADPFADAKTPTDPFKAIANPFAPVMAAALAPTAAALPAAEPLDAPGDLKLSGASESLALEVLVIWGNSVLHVAHLNPPRPFVVGEPSETDPVDYALPREALGTERLELVRVDAESVSALSAEGNWEAMGKGGRFTSEAGEFRFKVRLGGRSPLVPKGFFATRDYAPLSYLAATLATFGSFMGALAFSMPPMGLDDDSAIDKDRVLMLSQYLNAAAEREMEQLPPEVTPDSGPSDGGEEGAKAGGPSGQAGKESSKKTQGKIAVKGPSENRHMELSRHEAIKLAADFGMIGLLKGGLAADPDAPTSPFGGDITLGSDDISAQGHLWDVGIGEAIGAGGLGLSGVGFGADGIGDTVGAGMGSIGTGTGAGCSVLTGCDGTIGNGHGRLGPGHTPRAPKIGSAKTTVSGRIPPEVIRRIVRQNFGRFRMCYEQGLARNPNLAGRVAVRFVIGRDGAVSQVSAGGDVSDSRTVSCVQSAFYGLSFPAPDDGIATVTYPLIFSPE